MRRGQVHGLASQHHGLGAALRAAFGKPCTAHKMRLHDGVMEVHICAFCNGCSLGSPQARS